MKKIVFIVATTIVALGIFIGCKKSNQALSIEEKNAAYNVISKSKTPFS